MATVEISHAEKFYGDLQVLFGVDIEIVDGEFVVLVGPSGCGKSTLLRMIAGLEDISGGEIKIGEKVVNLVSPKDRNIAMVFQNYALYPHMTVRKNMGFSLRLNRVTKEEIERRVVEAARILDLEDYLDRYPRALSGGQRQRVAMGRAIVRDPEVFLFDEPLSNLDAKLRVQMRAEIKRLHQRLGTTSIYVTHDQVEAMTMADRIVVMKGGVIQQIGTPLALYDTPQNVFVAGFIGSPQMNLQGARINRDSGKATAVAADGTVFPLPDDAPSETGQEIVYGYRPEDMVLAPDGGIEAKISLVEHTGSEILVGCSIAGNDSHIVLRERHDLRAGQTIHVLPNLDKLHLFDRASGNRLAG